MDKNDAERVVKEGCCVKVSDWIAFLAGEKHGAMSTVVSFAMLLAALITIILLTRGHTVVSAIGSGVMALVLLGFVQFVVFRPVQARGRLAETVLDRIMNDELKDVILIRQEWVDGVAELKRRRWRPAIWDK